MSMPGGWTMSMLWMRAPGQTWLGATTSFLAMWVAMMAPMMAPVLVSMLRQYRRGAATTGAPSLALQTGLVALGYFSVWTLAGLALYPCGVAMARVAMQVPAVACAVPIVAALVVVLAGVVQWTGWKARRLIACASQARRDGAFVHGVRRGVACVACCANLMAALLALGLMDVRAMLLVTSAMAIERLAPRGRQHARAVGVVAAVLGAIMLGRAAGLT